MGKRYTFKKVFKNPSKCSCRIWKCQPMGQNFNRNKACQALGWNSDPEGNISLSYMDWVMMQYFSFTVKPVLVAPSNKQATCIKQASVQFPKRANTLKCTCIKQAPVLSKHFLIVP